ncbi:MAG: glycosyltransferase [Chloroflexi bacterium]|nr:glycosyltransferase [Chloroflexota bacterium]
MSKVSVIIPCFNQGAYLEEAVGSVLAQTFDDTEIIIVDDGSDDPATILLLDQLGKTDVRIIRTRNNGLAAARNRGIREATGEYILPLDADDKIGREYASLAVSIFDSNPDIGIVYCEAVYFGLKNERWQLPEYSLDHILKHNIIFCSAFFRKEDWAKVGGYNINMVYGWEDWDFWLSLIGLHRRVYRIPRVLFYYRLKEASMVQSVDEDKDFFMRLHACLNHRDLFRQVANIEIHIKIAELFLDTGLGFHHHQSMKSVVFADQREVVFDLGKYRGIKRLRFDPINTRAFLHLEEAGITDTEGVFHPLTITKHNGIKQVGADFLFDTEDPNFYFDIGDVSNPFQFIARIKFFSIGTEVVEDILRYKDREFSNLESFAYQNEQEISGLRGVISQNEQTISALQCIISQNEQMISDLQNVIFLNEQAISDLRFAVSQNEQTISDLQSVIGMNERTISKLQNAICQKEHTIAVLSEEKKCLERDLSAELQRIRGDLAATQLALINREDVITGMIQSTSWRLTKPLRFLKGLVMHNGVKKSA